MEMTGNEKGIIMDSWTGDALWNLPSGAYLEEGHLGHVPLGHFF